MKRWGGGWNLDKLQTSSEQISYHNLALGKQPPLGKISEVNQIIIDYKHFMQLTIGGYLKKIEWFSCCPWNNFIVRTHMNFSAQLWNRIPNEFYFLPKISSFRGNDISRLQERFEIVDLFYSKICLICLMQHKLWSRYHSVTERTGLLIDCIFLLRIEWY